jgi:ribonuclease D
MIKIRSFIFTSGKLVAALIINLSLKLTSLHYNQTMETSLSSAPIWVNTPTSLTHLVRDLSTQPRLAIDTESNSLYAYQERVCLIQFSTASTDYLVDPLALSDLSELAPIFSNPDIEKVFHASEYDIICLRRDYQFSFTHIFDTMQAARILGRTAVGLGSILEAEFGLKLNKRYQRADWGIRPIPPDMLNYARLDTHYLLPLRDRLAEALQTAGLWQLAQEEFDRLCNPSLPSENGYSRLLNNRELSARQNTVLHELCHYRDQQARRLNVPPFKVLSNDMLIEIAQHCPQTPVALENLTHLPARLRTRHGEQILRAVQKGLSAPLAQRPCPPPKPDEAYLTRAEKLREWRKQAAQQMGVESDIILPRETLEAIACSNPQNIQELARIMDKFPWRLKRYGEDILRALHSKE